MKKFYQDMEIEIVVLSTGDIVTFSENEMDDVTDDIFNPNA